MRFPITIIRAPRDDAPSAIVFTQQLNANWNEELQVDDVEDARAIVTALVDVYGLAALGLATEQPAHVKPMPATAKVKP